MKPIMMLGMPNCGSTWLAPIIATYSGLSYYDKEFFNPGTNPLHREEIASGFGSEQVSTYMNIANDVEKHSDALDAIFESTWAKYTWDFDKEVYMAWKLPWVTRHFTCFVLDRKPGSLFPASRANVLIWYEAIHHSLMAHGRVELTAKRTLLSRAMLAHRIGRELLLRAGLPIIDLDVFSYGTPTRIARELREVPVHMNVDAVVAEVMATRKTSRKTWREID